jgi:hypothetical protein
MENILSLFDLKNITNLGEICFDDLSFIGYKISEFTYKVKSERFSVLSFFITFEKQTIDSIIFTIGIPSVGIHLSSNHSNRKDFGFGLVSSRDFVYDSKLKDEYDVLVWRYQRYVIQFFRQDAVFNDTSLARIEVSVADLEVLSKL